MPAVLASDAAPFAAQEAPRGWLNIIRLCVGLGSLVATFWVGVVAAPTPTLFFALVLAGLFVFAGMMVALGRDVSRRWLAFGARLGFRPASRRAVIDMGTDRPALVGAAGRHLARLRLGATRRGGAGEEWLQVEIEILARDEHAWVHVDLDHAAPADDVRAMAHASDERTADRVAKLLEGFMDRGPFVSRIRLDEGRLCVRAPFYGFNVDSASELVRGAAELADALERP